MKKKNKTILIIFLIVSVVLLLAFMIIFPIILKKRWIWVWLPSIIISVSWGIYGLIVLIKKLNESVPTTTAIKTTEVIEWHLNRVKEDENNGDNLILKEKILGRYGEQGKIPTPVLVMDCYGTEKQQRRVIIINLNNWKEEFDELFDPTDEKIEKLKNKISENPVDERFEDVENLTSFGMQKIRRPYNPSSQKQRDEIEKKKTEETNAV